MTFNYFKKTYQKAPVRHFTHNVTNDVIVSVIVLTYNHENYIVQCLESILDQETEFKYEILLGEDNSTDNTRNICLDYAKKYPDKIRLFLHKNENKIKVDSIPTGNFNAIYNLFSASGKFIAYCDGDDYWSDPLKLQKQVCFLQEKEEYSFCYHEFIEKSNLNRKNYIDLEQPNFDLIKDQIINLEYHPLLSTVCFRNIFPKLPEEILKVINLDSFVLSLLGNYGPAKFLDKITPNIYRRNSGGIWSKNGKILKLKIKSNTIRQLHSYYRKKKQKDTEKAFKIYFRNINRSLFISYIKQNNFFAALKLTPYIF